MQIYIIHGYGASPSDHWFAWLKQELQQRGASVSILDLPTPDNPQPAEWQQALKAQIPTIDQNTFFVAHSLGSITLLSFLEEISAETRIGGYILVSGFNDSLPILPQLDTFIQPELAYEKLIQITDHRVIIAALDDAIVPHALSESLANALNAKYIPVERGGHFLGSDGFTEFPLLLAELAKIIAR